MTIPGGPMRYLLAAVAFATALATTDARAQTLIDFSPAGGQTTLAPRTWNNVDTTTGRTPVDLFDQAGAPTGAVLTFSAGLVFQSGNSAGATTATLNSPLAARNYPASAMSDCLFGSNAYPVAEFTLTNLDPNAIYDFVVFSSRMGVGDSRATEYTFSGANSRVTVLDPSNNQSNVATVVGVGPTATGTIVVRVKAATSNTNASGYYYLNTLEFSKRPGPLPPQLSFTTPFVTLSRPAGKPTGNYPLSVMTNDTNAPTVLLTAVDQATNQPPTWMSVPGAVTAGQGFQLAFGAPSVGVGTYRASLTATASGYAPSTAVVTLTVRPAGSLNLLYYGNSFSQGNGTVPTLVEYIAQDAGEPTPNTIARLVGGKDLFFHLTDPVQAAAITSALSPGEEWDFVILQGFSTEATDRLGNPTAFRDNAKAIVANVRAHSPSAKVIMFQTWARAQGHSFYTGSPPIFNGPIDMHRQIEKNYTLAVSDLNQAFGSGTARRADCGQPAALFNFDPAIYATDRYHAGQPITLMSAMAIYTAIYRKPIGSFEPNYSGNTPLVGRLNAFNIDVAAWRAYAGIADRGADPSLRPAPGSGEDLLLESGVDEPVDARPVKELSMGQTLDVELTSPIGTYGGGNAFLVMSWYATGAPPSPLPGLPEVHIDPARYVILAASPTLSTLAWRFPMPVALPGWSATIQGVVPRASAKTGRFFTVTDGHEIRLK